MSGVTATTYIRNDGPHGGGVIHRFLASRAARIPHRLHLRQPGHWLRPMKPSKIRPTEGDAKPAVPRSCALPKRRCSTPSTPPVFATTNREPRPKPFDASRDGLVIGEGGHLVLESLDHALPAAAPIICELVGLHQLRRRPRHQPTAETMQIAMQLALADAHLSPDAIGYINAHGTATDRGDIVESLPPTPCSATPLPSAPLKGNLGHTLGACGAIES